MNWIQLKIRFRKLKLRRAFIEVEGSSYQIPKYDINMTAVLISAQNFHFTDKVYFCIALVLLISDRVQS